MLLLTGLTTACSQVPTADEPVVETDDAWAQKVSDAVVARAESEGQATFWVELREKADLSGAERRGSKAERGAYVVERLRQHAARSQAGVLALLTERKVEHRAFWISNAIHVTGDRALIEEIARRPEVASVKEPETLEVRPQQEGANNEVISPPAVDGVEWNIARVGAPRVWQELGVRGEGIVVANIDTGVQFDHPALLASYRGRLSNGRTDNNYNFFAGSPCPSDAPCDYGGHGTHVMGIEVGSGGEGKNQIGVAPGARWIAASASGELERLAAGQWMLAPTDLRGENPRPDLAPDVVNNSWFSRFDRGNFYKDVLDAWLSAGIFPVFAAGNDGGQGCRSHTWPASFATAYAVANTMADDSIYRDSSRGPGDNGETKPDIAAPGTDIRSAFIQAEYGRQTGTSQAAPHVAGAVALLWSAAPALEGDVAATRRVLDQTARDLDVLACGGTREDNNMAGQGLMDIYAAALAAPQQPVGSLSGRVRRAASNTPIADATLLLDGPRSKWLRSDADGAFRLDRVLPGRYRYRLSAYGHRDASGVVTVRAGAPTTFSPALIPLPTGAVHGVVRAGGRPVAGAVVAVPNSPAHARTDADGRYELRLPLGSQQLVVEPPNRCSEPTTLPATVVANGIPLDVDLTVVNEGYGYTCEVATSDYREGTDKLALTGSDGAVAELKLPFSLAAFGARHERLFVSTHGVIGLSAAPEPLVSELLNPLPNGTPGAASLFPFFTWLDVDASAGIYTTVGKDEAVIEWRNVRVRPLVSAEQQDSRISFSVTVRSDATISFHYRGLSRDRWSAGINAAIGLQDASGSEGFGYGSGELGTYVRDGLALTFRPPASDSQEASK